MMKTILLCALFLVAGFHGFANDELASPAPAKPAAGDEVLRIKAQELSRSLVELKLAAVALRQSTPVDERALSLNQAQQTALNEELLRMALAPLEAQFAEQSKHYAPGHPDLMRLQSKIDELKATFSRAQ